MHEKTTRPYRFTRRNRPFFTEIGAIRNTRVIVTNGRVVIRFSCAPLLNPADPLPSEIGAKVSVRNNGDRLAMRSAAAKRSGRVKVQAGSD
jgi:hypothetical protein